MSTAPDPAQVAAWREQVRQVLLARVARTDQGREEAIREFVAVSRPDLGPEAAGIIAAKAPPLLPSLTEKWIGLFVDRLFETVPGEQIALLCDGSQDNEAALALAYVMFLESARMEKQMAADLAAAGLGPAADGSDDATLVADVCRHLAKAEETRRQQAMTKAACYQANKKGRPN
jgi:hypothetical protein